MGSVGARENNTQTVSTAAAAIAEIQNNEWLQRSPKSKLILTKAIEDSQYYRDDADIRGDVYNMLEETGDVRITSITYTSVPDLQGYSDADVRYIVTTRPRGKTRPQSEDKRKALRLKVLDI